MNFFLADITSFLLLLLHQHIQKAPGSGQAIVIGSIGGALASDFATSVTLHQVPGYERNNP